MFSGPMFSGTGPSGFSSRTLIACLLGAALLGGCDTGSPAPEQAANTSAPDAVAAAPDEAPATAGAATPAAALDRSHKGEAAPTVAFETPEGKPVTLAAFRGKPVLLNLWATWCGPCVVELPTLDAAAAALDGKVTVLAVSQDMDAAKVAPFLTAKGATRLKPYRDPKLGLSLAYKANLPTTILFDSTGHEVWRRSGGYAWNGAQARALIAEAR